MELRDADIRRLEQMIDDLRSMRDRLCEPKANSNPRYHAFSSAVTGLRRVVEDLEAEARST